MTRRTTGTGSNIVETAAGTARDQSVVNLFSQTITRWVNEALRFVTLHLVTVPGKGGRPRKWLSDTDRVRAHRARQRGDVEPPTFEEMSSGDHELARALRRQSQLEAQLADARQDIRWLEHDLAETEAKSAQLESELRSLRTEWQELLVEVAELNERVHHLSPGHVDTERHEPTPLSNRATRRRAARQRRP